jgi:MFS family permease
VTEPTSPLHIADYRLFWLARFTSCVATIGMVVVLGYQLYDLARGSYGMSIAQSAFQLGLLGLVQFLPMVLLTPVAGVVADRFDRKYVAIAANLIDLLVILALALATQNHALSLPLLFALGALHGTARVFIGPAMSAITPNIVPAPLLPRAIAIGSMAWQAGAVLGPAAAGFLYAGGASLPYWSAAALLCVAIIALSTIRKVPPPAGNRHEQPVAQMLEGLRFVWSQHFLLGCVSLDLFAVILGGATALLPVFARDILMIDGAPVGAHGLGLMRAAPAVGASLVALMLARWPIAKNVGVKMLWSVAAYGLATLAFGLSSNFHLSLLLLLALGAADMVSVFIRSTLIQLNTPDAMRGRVSSISGLAISASNELGEMESGLAAALLGATGAVVLGGVGAIIITAIWAWKFPEIRRARTFSAHYHKEPE